MKKLLIIGGGTMGFAIASGIVSKNIYKKDDVIFIENKIKRIKLLKAYKYNVFNNLSTITTNNKKYIKVIILAVKPSDISKILPVLKALNFKGIIISILAGIKIQSISSKLSKRQPIARVMPNTPCQVGEGMSVLTFNKYVTKSQKKLVENIFNSIGRTLKLNEKYFDLVGAVNGSGPAYFCYLIESLIQGSSKLGLSKQNASKLVLQTALGTISLLNKKNITPEELRKGVTSKKGITEAALKVFKRMNFNNIVLKAISKAQHRSIELGRQ